MARDISTAALPYHEPGIVTTLILTSFILLLNVVNHVFDKLLYCGLLGQIALGVAWGSPGGKWIDESAEQVIVNLGYLGLLLLVYEGGLLTSLKSLKANLLLSSSVAATGIALPIGLSYILMRLSNATPIQAFAGGAALCSTSLGTTFAIMSASGLVTTRMGVVLTSAAMMDDVVGLVMVQVISNLGTSSSSFGPTTVIRPVFVSIAFAIITPIAARFVAKPLTAILNNSREAHPNALTNRLLSHECAGFVIHSAILIGMVTGATFAGTSGFLAAYLAGASISWWDSEVPHADIPARTGQKATHIVPTSKEMPSNPPNQSRRRTSSNISSGRRASRTSISSVSAPLPIHEPVVTTGTEVFERFYAQALNRILKPFFFASVGFSIPITRMFSGTIVWKGIVYTLLMFVAKVACGLWLIRVPSLTLHSKRSKVSATKPLATSAPLKTTIMEGLAAPTNPPPRSNQAKKIAGSPQTSHTDPNAPAPLSLYPGIIVGSAMVARGEIGFLISALAESNGVFGEETDPPIFLIVTWAIILCTIVGPILVGSLVKRVKRLEEGTKRGRGRIGQAKDVLGVWGVE